MPPSIKRNTKRVVILSPVDYPFHSATARRISAMIAALQAANVPAELIRPVFRNPNPPVLSGVSDVDLRFLRALNTDRLFTRVLELTLFNLVAFTKLVMSRKAILAVQYETIHTFPAAFFARVILRCPCIAEDINIPPTLRRFGFFERLLAATADFVASAYADARKAVFVPTGITEQLIIRRNSLSFRGVRSVFVGTLTYQNNWRAIDHILQIDSILPDDVEARFFVVGGPIPPELHSRGRVVFLGHVDDRVLRRTYARGNIGLLPFFGSLTEGSKSKAIEYMAAGLLVVSSPEGAEYLPGFVPWKHYVPAASVEEMAQILQRARQNEKRFKAIARRGQEYALKRYRWPKLLRGYLRFIKGLHSRQ